VSYLSLSHGDHMQCSGHRCGLWFQ